MDRDGQITPADARIVLRISVKLESIEDYMDEAPAFPTGVWANDKFTYTFNADGTGDIDNGDGTGIGTTYEVAKDKNEVTIHPGTPEVSDVYTYAMPDADTLVLTDKDGKDLVLKRNAG